MDAFPPADETLDCAGLLCPLPVLRAQRRLRTMAEGAVLVVIATDAPLVPHQLKRLARRPPLARRTASTNRLRPSM